MREFGELESAIMDVMWDAERPYAVREVRERMTYARSVAYTTVMTVMDILHRKGVLCRDKHGRAWRYWPSEAREEHDARLMAEVLRSGGNRVVTMRRFIERVSDEEMESLRVAVRDVFSLRGMASLTGAAS
ncbi:MAG TPA: BlaI/MecI/CopY family transcriptional regulator [Streptosporangiaceae bacterium]|nr:BlaI/MecI/CopY family transcriptional regulator [Streptosporangiaceae bacterium]